MDKMQKLLEAHLPEGDQRVMVIFAPRKGGGWLVERIDGRPSVQFMSLLVRLQNVDADLDGLDFDLGVVANRLQALVNCVRSVKGSLAQMDLFGDVGREG